jgi:SpoVK/Ycf46/Vps4 family AAA+-type ATPase
MTRAGRFDEKFFVDLPSRHEREEIAKVHLGLLGCDLGFSDLVAEITDDWTGAEVEQLIKSAARRTKRKLTLDMISTCKDQIIPISKTAGIKALREWAETNLRRANDLEEISSTGRKVGRR